MYIINDEDTHEIFVLGVGYQTVHDIDTPTQIDKNKVTLEDTSPDFVYGRPIESTSNRDIVDKRNYVPVTSILRARDPSLTIARLRHKGSGIKMMV